MAVVGSQEFKIWKVLAGLLIVASVVVSFRGLTEDWTCSSEESEATRTLELIHSREQAFKKDKGVYVAVPPCAFTDEGHGCASEIPFFIPGTSLFAYRVLLTDDGFLATAVGVSSRQHGAVFHIDQTGVLRRAGSVCGD